MLTGRIIALAYFISKLTDRCRPFFQAFYNRVGFEWGSVQAEAFQKLKKYLSNPPILVALKPGEPLFFYFSISTFAINSVLFLESEVSRGLFIMKQGVG